MLSVTLLVRVQFTQGSTSLDYCVERRPTAREDLSMSIASRRFLGGSVAVLALAGLAGDLPAQTASPAAPQPQAAAKPGQPEPDGFKDDAAYQQSRKLLSAIDDILTQTAEQRAKMKDLPSKELYVIPPIWRETREDREANIRRLLDSVMEIVTDAPVVAMQEKLAEHRQTITKLKDEIAGLRERRLHAPAEGFMPGILSETQGSIDGTIADREARIKSNQDEIGRIKQEIKTALGQSGIDIADTQLDLLLDSVLGGDMIKLVTAFQAARGIDDRLSELLSQSNENVKAARRYFAMHAALFAMMIHAHDTLIEKIDTQYMAKLRTILKDVRKARDDSSRLLAGRNRPDQKRALEANVASQDFAEKVASFYRDYLDTQRRQLAEARDRTARDLAIADNTYETVEASFQLHLLMEDARTSFEAIQKLEAPGFDQVFKNDQLRREFETLTRRLEPSS
jgi:hypothetical protein